jgi:hypothetical protein
MVCRHESCGNARVTLRKEKTVKRAKSILFGATVLAIAAGSALAQPSEIGMEDSSASASAMYSVDENRDGRADREIMLEQSDSLA